MPQVPLDDARAAVEAGLRGLGYPPPRAALIADHLLDAEMRGTRSHGLGRLPWLAEQPGVDPGAAPTRCERIEGLARWDASGGIGYAALAEALDAELGDPPGGARLVVVEGCFPTGRLGWYAERVAGRGLICFVTATSPARIVHPAGGPPAVGTNPLCLAVPDGAAPVAVDVSMGRVTFGDVLAAAATGASLPAGASATPDSRLQTDPGEIVAGRAGIVPFGGDQAYKGFALAAMVELLVGALAETTGHAAVALLAAPRSAPAARLRAAVGDRRLPGDGSRARRERAAAAGSLDIADELWAQIGALRR